MNEWEKDKKWSDHYIDEIKSILGRYLIGESSQEDDQMKNTDLVVLKMEAVRIGCRIRRPGFAALYGDEFTIRCNRPSGVKTELTKIIEGWGDYFFYGHAGEDGKLAAWALCDLKSFRLWFHSYIIDHAGKKPGQLEHNTDGSSKFLAFRFDEMPNSFLVARKCFSEEIDFDPEKICREFIKKRKERGVL